MHVHFVLDLVAWVVGLGAGYFAHVLRGRAPQSRVVSAAQNLPVSYYAVLGFGAVGGAFLLGSINLMLSGHDAIVGRSLVGALAGAIFVIEIYKKIFGIKGSTGVAFVGAFCVGAALGRVGCYLSGLEDFTYGIATTLPWGVDFGDGIMRHPVQLYEAGSMAIFAAAYFTGLYLKADWALRRGFYIMVLVYAGGRFVFEFLKPYTMILGPFNVFHLVCGALIIYALYMLRGQNEPS